MTEDSPRDEHRARDEHRGGSAGADLRQPPPGDLVLPNPSEDEAADEVFDDLLEDYIPDPQKRSLVVRQITITAAARFSSPYPPVSYLRGLEEVVPGGAQRLMDQADLQASHRRELEHEVVFKGELRANIGQALGFVVAVLFLGAATYLIATGNAVAGTILGTVDLVALVSVFVLGRREQSAKAQRQDPPTSSGPGDSD